MSSLLVKARELLLAKWTPMPYAERSGLPYIRHIDEGLKLLQGMTQDEHTLAAFILHPVVQADADYMGGIAVLCGAEIPLEVLCLVLEYRRCANSYLPRHEIRSPVRSPDPRVNQMLIADKLQNLSDLREYNAAHPRYDDLVQYFEAWLSALLVRPPQSGARI